MIWMWIMWWCWISSVVPNSCITCIHMILRYITIRISIFLTQHVVWLDCLSFIRFNYEIVAYECSTEPIQQIWSRVRCAPNKYSRVLLVVVWWHPPCIFLVRVSTATCMMAEIRRYLLLSFPVILHASHFPLYLTTGFPCNLSMFSAIVLVFSRVIIEC
jgi:hypothetical protein